MIVKVNLFAEDEKSAMTLQVTVGKAIRAWESSRLLAWCSNLWEVVPLILGHSRWCRTMCLTLADEVRWEGSATTRMKALYMAKILVMVSRVHIHRITCMRSNFNHFLGVLMDKESSKVLDMPNLQKMHGRSSNKRRNCQVSNKDLEIWTICVLTPMRIYLLEK